MLSFSISDETFEDYKTHYLHFSTPFVQGLLFKKLFKKVLSLTYEVDESPRTLTSALVLNSIKSYKSYLLGGWITKDTDGCLGLKTYDPSYGVDGSPRTLPGALVLKLMVLPMGWMDHQGHRRVPWS